MDVCFILSNNNKASTKSSSKLVARDSVRQRAVANCKIDFNLKADLTKNVFFEAKTSADTLLKTTRKDFFACVSKLVAKTKLKAKCSGDTVYSCHIKPSVEIKLQYTDKSHATSDSFYSFKNFSPTEKLYPISDVDTELSGNFFINEKHGQVCFESINEGVVIGNPLEKFGNSVTVSDEKKTFIQPSSIYSDGSFRYSCEVNNPSITPNDSFLLIRASAPIKNYGSYAPPSYRFYNIFLKDFNGNTAVEYEELVVRGDSDHQNFYDSNFTTYIFGVKENYCNKFFSDPLFPDFRSDIRTIRTQEDQDIVTQDGYIINTTSNQPSFTLEFSLDIICEDISFSEGFDVGYEDRSCNINFSQDSDNDYLAVDGAPIGAQSKFYHINPSSHIRITALEIANSGSSLGFGASDSLNCFIDVQSSGLRLTREILPVDIHLNTASNNIYPDVPQNLWSSSNGFDNTNDVGRSEITNVLRVYDTSNHITLDYTDNPSSGKLLLKFSHEYPKPINKYIGGAFNIGFNSLRKEFDYAGYKRVTETDSYFDVDEVFLRVIAKKDASNPDNFYLDVVGYSDDKFLAVTSQTGGFLQNIEGTGSEPLASGFFPADELGISSEAISEKDETKVRSDLQNPGGDHYLVDQSPEATVDSIEFQEYFVPLKIYEQSLSNDRHNNSLSSYFENLFLDICPIPTGASIAYISLVVTYKPSNALPLYVLAHGDKDLGSEDTKLFTSARKINDNPINTGPSYGPLSAINNIPHGYGFDETLKTNYSRRWRNVDGLVAVGPFDFNEFDFSFYNPQLPKPFFGGYFSFNDDVGNDIISEEMYDLITLQGSYIGNYDKIKNIGMRFTSTSLFNDPTSYATIDWTSINGYQADPLYGQIADAFDNAVRVSGDLGYISFPTFDISDGCAVFVRFSPDVSMSGVGYNLYNSGIVFSKHDAGNNLEIALGYENGYLTAYATDDANNLITIQDSIPHTDYTYPLSVIVTYNNNGDNKLILYTDNEKDSVNFQRLRAESNQFTITQSLSDLNFGYSHADQVGFNGFITDIAISAPTTQVIDVPLSFNASSFLDSIHAKYWAVNEDSTSEETSFVTQDGRTILTSDGQSLLYQEESFRDTNKAWSYVDKDLDDWHLGAFNICEFSRSFDRFTSRYGKDYIIHRVKSDGFAYSSYSDITSPSGVNFETSYHTQVENDMLRFYLSPEPDSFASPGVIYGIRPRISNSFVRGYGVFEEAFIVDTIIDHVTYDTIEWDDGQIGPKLMVSLYTKSKEDPDKPYKNIGLVNRSTHYLLPSGCIHKISSQFSFSDLFNEGSEGWSEFDQRLNSSELSSKYLSKEIEDMFLQYDLVYPSGSSYDSTLSIYGITVTLTEALHKARTIDNL
jgi:hypothetical protein